MSRLAATRFRSTRQALILTVLALIVTAAVAGVLANRLLIPGTTVGLGPLQLQLVHNPGVSFNIGADLPAWVVTIATGTVTAVIAVYAWRMLPTMSTLSRVGIAAILGGALANLIDRAIDGVVTDYLHTGWFPTFNLPDVFITGGAVLLVLGALTASRSRPAD